MIAASTASSPLSRDVAHRPGRRLTTNTVASRPNLAYIRRVTASETRGAWHGDDCSAGERPADRPTAPWRGTAGRRDRVRLQRGDRGGLDRSGLLARGHARTARRGGGHRHSCARRPARLVRADVLHLDGLPGAQPRRPGLRHHVCLGDPSPRAAAGVAERLCRVRRRRDRHGHAVGDCGQVPVHPRRLGRGRAIDARPRGGGDWLHRADDVGGVPRRRAQRPRAAGIAGRGGGDPGAVRRDRARQGVQRFAARLGPPVARVARPILTAGGFPGGRRPARGVRVLGVGRLRDRQRGVRGLGPRPRPGRGSIDADPPRGVRAGLERRSVGRRPRVSQRALGRRAECAGDPRARQPVRQAAGARGAHLHGGLDADDDHADGAHDAVDGALGCATGVAGPHPPPLRHPGDVHPADGGDLSAVDGHAAGGQSGAERARRFDHRDRLPDRLLLRDDGTGLRGVLPRSAARRLASAGRRRNRAAGGGGASGGDLRQGADPLLPARDRRPAGQLRPPRWRASRSRS